MTILFRPQGGFGWVSYTTSRDTIVCELMDKHRCRVESTTHYRYRAYDEHALVAFMKRGRMCTGICCSAERQFF